MTPHEDTAYPNEAATGRGTADAPEGSQPPEQKQEGGQETAAAPDPEATLWTGPTAWIVPGLVAALGLVGVWGGLTLETPPHAARPGPGAFPLVIGVLLLIAAACMAVVNVRNRGLAGSGLAWFEARPVLLVLAGVAVHTALLEILGWLLAGALLFWIVAYAFGARAYLRDAVVALSMSAAVQVGFSLGLGLALPGGFLGTVL